VLTLVAPRALRRRRVLNERPSRRALRCAPLAESFELAPVPGTQARVRAWVREALNLLLRQGRTRQGLGESGSPRRIGVGQVAGGGGGVGMGRNPHFRAIESHLAAFEGAGASRSFCCRTPSTWRRKNEPALAQWSSPKTDTMETFLGLSEPSRPIIAC
jgi:hypothetical protein